MCVRHKKRLRYRNYAREQGRDMEIEKGHGEIKRVCMKETHRESEFV